MYNKKIPTSVGIIVIIVIAIAVIVLVWKCGENKPIQIDKQLSLQNNNLLKKENEFKISDKWTLVSHGNFWNNPNLFVNRNYNFPKIEFSYPDNWDFKCCNDTDQASTHMIYSSKDHNKSLPYIRITDYVLSGCPTSQSNCSLDKTVKISADGKFNRLTSTIPAEDVLSKIKLNSLDTTAFAFNKLEEGNKTSKGYLINLGNDVIEIDFVNYELIGDTFIEKFLNRISFEAK